MSFPVNPPNGNLTIINNVVYVYNSEKGTWSKISSGQPQLSQYTDINATGTANIGNVITSQGVYWANGDAYYSAAAGSTTAGGIGTSIQFNDAGVLNGNTNFTYNKTTSAVTLVGNLYTANLIANGGQIRGYLTGAIGANTANTGAFTDLTASGNLTVTGNLTINGTQTVVNSTVVTVNDLNLVLANNAATSSAADGAGITVNGPTTAATILYTHSTSSWNLNKAVIGQSFTTLSGGQVIGYHTGAIGANTANTGVFTSVTTTSAGQLTGYHTGAIGANTANSGAFTTLTSSGQTGLGNTAVTGLYTTNGLFWANGTAFSSGGSGTPQGSNTYIQFNDNGTFGGAAGITYNKTSNVVTIAGNVTAGSISITGAGGQYIGYHTGSIGGNVPNTGVFTSVTTTSAGQITGYLNGPIGAAVANTASFTTLTVSSITSLGPLSNVRITGGINGYYIQTDGLGNLTWSAGTGSGGSGSPGGSNAQIQFNDAGSFLGNSALTFNKGTQILTAANAINANGFTTLYGTQVIGYFNGAIGANTANSAVFSTLNVSGATTFNNPTASSISASTIGNTGAAFQGETANFTGATTATSFTTLSGGQITGYHTGVIGANTANAGTFTTLTATTSYNGAMNGALNGTVGATTANTGAFTSVTTTGDVTVGGNLYVNGNTTVINANNITINDTVLYLGNNNPANNFELGIVGQFTAGSKQYTGIVRDHTNNNWTFFSNVATNPTGNVLTFDSTTNYDTIRVGNVQAVAGQLIGYHTGVIGANTANAGTFTTLTATTSYSGAMNGALNGTVGATTPNTGKFTSITTTSAGQITGYHTGAIGANTANTGVFTSVTTTSAGQLTGYHTGAIGANTANTGVFTSVTTTGGGQLIGYMTGPIGANTANSGVFTDLTTTGTSTINTINAVSLSAGTIGNSSAILQGDTIKSLNGGQITGYHTGVIGANTANAGTFTTLTATSGYQGATTGAHNGTVGATTANTGAFTTLTASGLSTFNTANAVAVNASTIGNTGAAFTGASINLTGTATVDRVTAANVYIGDIVIWSGNNSITGAAITASTATFVTGLTAANVQSVIGSVATGNFPTLNQNTTGSATGGASGPLNGPHNGTVGASTPNTGAFTTVTASTSIIAGTIGIWAGNATITGVTLSGVSAGATGPLTGPLNGTVGATTPNTGIFTSVITTSAGQLTGYHTGPIGANTANTGVFTSLTATSGYQGAATGPLNGTVGASSPNTGVFTSVTTTNAGQITGYHTGAIGANTANTGAFTTVTTTGNITTSGTTTRLGINIDTPKGAIQANGVAPGIYLTNTGTSNIDRSWIYFEKTDTTSRSNDQMGGINWKRTLTDGTSIAESYITVTGSTTVANGRQNITISANNDVIFQTAAYNGGTYKEMLRIKGTTGQISTFGSTPRADANLHVSGNIATETGGISGAGYIYAASYFAAGGTDSSGAAISNQNFSGTGNIGATGATFNTIFAKATTAQYADLAECYAADTYYDPGTVVEFGGEYELTIASENSASVAGIVSTNPAYLMNSAIEADFPVAVALTGRTPCKVHGPIRKGQMMVSAGAGYARASTNPTLGTVIGKSLENFEGNAGIIEVAVGRF